MDLQGLLSRVRDLQQQLGNDKQTLNVLTEQLEQAKASFHMTNGRIQEIAHLVEMEQKLIQEEGNRLKELEDGKVNQQTEGESPQE